MELLSLEQIKSKKDEILSRIEGGAVFVYPTDTVYGLGCNALDCDAVQKLREIKQTQKPLSVIAPSKEWIQKNCTLNSEAKEWLKKLPGPYTLVLPLKNKNAVCSQVTNQDTIGVRMIDHVLQEFVRDFDSPIVTTSANRTGKEIMTTLDRLDVKIKSKVDMVLYEGEKYGNASKIVDLTNDSSKVLRD